MSVLVAPQLASLTFIPYEIIDGVEGLTYGSFSYKALTLKDKDNKDGEEKQKDICHPISAVARKQIEDAVFAEYNRLDEN